jgi:hypothetical protein
MKKLFFTVAIYAASMTMFGQADKISYEIELHDVIVSFMTTCEEIEFDHWQEVISNEQAFDDIQIASRILARELHELNEYWNSDY